MNLNRARSVGEKQLSERIPAKDSSMCDVFRVRLERGLATTRKNKQPKPGTPAQSGRAIPCADLERNSQRKTRTPRLRHAARNAGIFWAKLRMFSATTEIGFVVTVARRWWSDGKDMR